MRRAASDYVEAVRAEFSALENGDAVEAREIDEARVDPAFESVLTVAEGLVAQETAAARAKTSATKRLALGLVGITVLAASVGVWFVLRHRDRRADERLEEVAGRRFRSLVESSTDIVTVVSGVRELTVMSPTLGFLSCVVSATCPADITDVSDLIPANRLDDWSEFDALVSVGESVDAFGLQLARRDGSVADVELIGRPLSGEPGHRVWVWRDVSERTALTAELSHRAFHDALTGLANRALLHNRTEHALELAERSGEPVAVLVCDLDGFKMVNDALGHNRGDELLMVVSTRMNGCLRTSDTLARLGGDEFAVLLENTDIDTARELAERILDVVAVQVSLGEREVFPSLSIGAASFEPGISTEEILRRADVAMYQAKRAGKARTEVYRPGLGHEGNGTLVMQTELRRAVLDGGLTLAYQPTVSLVDGSVSSVEALVRWDHPVLGSIPPATFIPMAEESGTIVALGKWVLTEACRAAVTLRGTNGSGIMMHVNISPHQLNDPTLVSFVKETLSGSGLDPGLLVLEVTEGALLANPTSIDRLRELSGHGVRLAIDDFGTGYASITYLQRLPIDILKIDRSFVSGDALPAAERRAFLATIISMARNLDVTSVAEGVETDEQRFEIAELGCDRGQGYLWARPVDLATLRGAIDVLSAASRLDHGG